jgi:hypothetical protein
MLSGISLTWLTAAAAVSDVVVDGNVDKGAGRGRPLRRRVIFAKTVRTSESLWRSGSASFLYGNPFRRSHMDSYANVVGSTPTRDIFFAFSEAHKKKCQLVSKREKGRK